MENGQELGGSRGLSRRDMIKGAAVAGVAAWSAPVVIDSLVSPAAAESLPPCHPQFQDSAVNWVVDNAIFQQSGGCPGGTYCPPTGGGNAGKCPSGSVVAGQTFHSHRDVVMHFDIGACNQPVKVAVTPVSGKAVWCAWSGNTTVNKTIAANTTGSLIFPTVGESLPGGCTAVAHCDSCVNDGIHVNPCETNQIMWEYWIGATYYGPYYYTPPVP